MAAGSLQKSFFPARSPDVAVSQRGRRRTGQLPPSAGSVPAAFCSRRQQTFDSSAEPSPRLIQEIRAFPQAGQKTGRAEPDSTSRRGIKPALLLEGTLPKRLLPPQIPASFQPTAGHPADRQEQQRPGDAALLEQPAPTTADAAPLCTRLLPNAPGQPCYFPAGQHPDEHCR